MLVAVVWGDRGACGVEGEDKGDALDDAQVMLKYGLAGGSKAAGEDDEKSS